MGSLGYNLGSIMVRLNYDDPTYFFYIENSAPFQITLTLEKNGKKEQFEESEQYGEQTLLADLFKEIEKGKIKPCDQCETVKELRRLLKNSKNKDDENGK